ncbi:MAG: cell wall-binding repeat-containing protein [Peptococcaceae bacterium]|nr:cell wall-binding repeat-containing protein [Peptococcaceae bacterium]
MRNKYVALAMVVALCFLTFLPGYTPNAMANTNPYTYDISQGNITISAGTTSGTIQVQYGSGQTVNITTSQSITIIDSSPSTPTANCVTVDVNLGTLNITLEDVNISGTSPFSIGSGTNVDLTLVGQNTLNADSIGYPGLNIGPGSTLEVTAASTGSLTALGGSASSSGAGIGGGGNSSNGGGNCGTVTINGGTVTAIGGSGTQGGAGIGGGGGLDNGGSGGTVTINGGTVTATGGSGGGAGIGGGGGGYVLSVGTLTINGGSVKASSIQPTVYDSSNNQEYPVTISGLPASAGMSYSVNGGSSVSCSTDASNNLYLWLPQTTGPADTVLITSSGTQYLASVAVSDTSANNFTAKVLPAVTTNTATNITSSGATLNGTINANGDSTTVTFDYGTSTSYGSTTPASLSPVTGSTDTTVSAVITGLLPNTTYHYRVEGVNSGGTTDGLDETFTTLAVPISDFAITAKTSSTATFTWTAASGATGIIIQQSPSGANTWTTASTIAGSIAVDSATATVPGLSPATGYDFKLAVTGGANAGNSDSVTVTTDAAPPTPILTDLTLSGTIPNLSVGQAVYNLNNLSLSGTDQFGAPFGLSGQTVQWNLASGNSYASLTGSTLTPLNTGSGTVTATIYGVTSNGLGFIVIAPSHSGGGGGSHGSSLISPTSSTVTGSVSNGTTGANIANITATITTDASGNDTVSMNAGQLAVLREPDGTTSPLSDLTQVGFTSSTGKSVPIAADGTVQMAGLARGTDNNYNITYDLGNGQTITIGTLEIKIDSGGNVTLSENLIDPYGLITDAATGKTLAGVNVTLYYADTARNKAAGKSPNTAVALPGIAGFKPNNNHDPQTSDVNGAYGFMVFPDTDYYIVATKYGYVQYTSPTISVGHEIVHWDFKMSPASGVTRQAGQSRVDTALAIAKAEYPGKIENAVLTIADTYPDALAGSVLAYQMNAPILLVENSTAEQAKVLTYLKDNLDTAGTVYILGGTGVVGMDIETQIQADGFKNITRLGGADRYATSVQIAQAEGVATGTPIVLVSGENYPDALSVSSVAGQRHFPILLVQNDGISESVSQEIAAIKPSKVFIIGGEGVIIPALENQVAHLTGLAQANIVRIGGADRYATSLAVAQYFNLTGQIVCVSTGSNYPDALAGSVYAAKHNAPIILAHGSLPDQTVNYLKSKNLTEAIIFGGDAAVSQSIEEQLDQLIGH